MLKYSTLISLTIIIFHGMLFGQTGQGGIDILKHERDYHQFGKMGVPILSPSHTNIFGHRKSSGHISASSILNRSLRPMISETGTFQPLTGPYGGNVRSIAVDSGGWLFIATDGEVYRSKDNGNNWEMNLFPSQLHNFVEPVTVIGPNVIVAETDFNNFISTDRGESWNYLFDDVQGFTVDTNGVIYAGSNYNGVRMSNNAGKTWIQFALAGKKIWKVVLCDSGKIACPSDSGIYFSNDTGATWNFKPYETQFTWNLVSDKKGHLFVLRYYGQGFELYRSDNFGENWQHIVLPVQGNAYRIYVESDGRIFVPAGTNILTSTDAGATWKILNLGVSVLTVGWDTKNNLLAGSFSGIFRWEETNNHWSELNNGIHARQIGTITFTSSGTMIVYSNGQWMRSSDDGKNWSRMIYDSTVLAYGPLLSHSSGSLFIAASLNHSSEIGLLRSTDDGISWRKISFLSNYYAITTIIEGSSSDILVGTYFGDIYRSIDEGNTWRKVVSNTVQTRINSLAADRKGNYYAAKDSTVLISNNGQVWEKTSLARNISSFESISIDSHDDIFLSSSSNGVYHSRDQGKTWNLMNEGLYDRYVMSSITDDSENVVLGTATGIFRLADSADSWLRFSNGLPHTFTTTLAISPQGFLYAGTQSFGIYKSAVPLGKRILKTEHTSTPTVDIREFNLYQNYPNPFNDQTIIRYEVPMFTKVDISIYNTLGHLIDNLFSGELSKGNYSIAWAPRQFASGLYFCLMNATSGSKTFSKTLKIQYLR